MEILTDELLVELYKKEMLNTVEIAKQFGYKSPQTIANKLEKLGIPRRRKRKAQKTIEISKDVLENHYFGENKTLSEIAIQHNCGSETIRRLMIKYGIKRKDKTRNLGGWNKGKSLPKNQRKYLSNLRKKMYESGRLIHWNTGNHWSNEVKRKISRSLKGKMVGKENPNWSGGKDSLYQQWLRRIRQSYEYREFRLKVFARDNFCCKMCGKKSKGDIQLHHIKTVFMHPWLIMVKENAITLCEKCHQKVRNHEKEFEEELYGRIHS